VGDGAWDTEKLTSIIDLEGAENEGVAGSEVRNLENIFIFFLENGLLPWYANRSHFERFNLPDYFQKSFKTESFRIRLKSVLKKSEHSFYRFVKQCDEKLVVHFIELLLKEKQHEPDTILHRMEILNRDQRVDFLIYMLACMLELGHSSIEFHYQKLVHGLKINQTQSEKEKIQFEFLKQVIDLVTPGTYFPEEQQNINDTGLFLLKDKVLEIHDKTELFSEKHLPELLNNISPEAFNKSEKIVSEKAIFINTAGLVIAHPFIWNFLQNTGCADKKHIYATEISRAAYLLRFLAVGDENVPEFDLIFEKFLCGIPPQYPLERQLTLSDQDKLECEEMLKSMIVNWPALKNSSPDTVRQMFLQRDGKLDLTRNPGKLFVERKAQDVLLEKLQWNISVVKLPSMSEVLFVEW
jgi:hypothetical protein